MKSKEKITSFSSFLLLVVFLTASTGFTVITHSCQYTAEESSSTFFLSATKVESGSCYLTLDCNSDQYQTEEETEPCCSSQHQAANMLMTCCKYENTFIKVNYFIPIVTKVSPPELITFPANHYRLTFTILQEKPLLPPYGLGKYGGRSITTIHRQLII